ncbi:phosphoribosylanthranilate isomerase [Weeksella sp. HMSC059D05]|uniref:phosphoribosylanthranilate isomerase n=1 Tax=Weeksella sp. HMSC059D05 TaxID=1715139 RepID=UPI0008A2DEC8|nr:phosphoribosylanthranilate isomerase [Weeksella sp. HMSC059D05]OFM82998.1 phosphoribosylanthranilate isomerase [Weeksella sp. HMSC059D05]
MKRYQLKVCGNKHINNLMQLATLHVDYVGYIFYDQSPRRVENNLLFSIFPNANKVGVFVNDSLSNMVEKVQQYHFDVVQLHGDEPLELIAQLRKALPNTEIWRAISVGDVTDFEDLEKYQPLIDAFLFDTKTKLYGGSGKQFDWQLLQNYTLDTPFFLSGGLHPTDTQKLLEIQHPQLLGFDINSGFETAIGVKDIDAIATFQQKINQPKL